MKAVSKGCSVNRAAIEHRVPRTTLQDRISGKVQHGMEAAMNTHPISSIAAIIPGSTISVVSCSSDVTSPSTFSVPVHPISTETKLHLVQPPLTSPTALMLSRGFCK